MKTLLHNLRRTPLLHMSLMVGFKVLSTLTVALILFASALALADVPAKDPAASLDDPTVYLRIIFEAVEKKNWGVVAAGVCVLLIALFRAFGKKLHDFIPDDSAFDKPLHFIYDTKPGGWILNLVTAVGGGFGVALLAGKPVDFELVRTVLTVSLSAAGIWGGIKDLMEHFGKAKPPPATGAAAAGAAAAQDPGSQLNK